MVSNHQISKLHSKFYLIHDSKKSQDCTAKSPNLKLTPKFPRSWEKSPSSGSAGRRRSTRFHSKQDMSPGLYPGPGVYSGPAATIRGFTGIVSTTFMTYDVTWPKTVKTMTPKWPHLRNEPLVSGGNMKLSGGWSSGRRPRIEARSAEQGRGLSRVSPPQDGSPGVSPLENFEIWGAIWCNLVHFGKKLTVLQLSTFVNENTAIMLDSGIDIVAYFFNFFSSMNALFFAL